MIYKLKSLVNIKRYGRNYKFKTEGLRVMDRAKVTAKVTSIFYRHKLSLVKFSRGLIHIPITIE